MREWGRGRGLIALLLGLATGLPVLGAERPADVTRAAAFDRDPGWDGHNNRSKTPEPREIRQDFGYVAAGGGRVGGFISPAGEAAWYAKPIPQRTFDGSFMAAGTLVVEPGGGNTLFGFFNANTVNEWRTPNSVVFRINGRGEGFHTHLEYATSKWRAGGNFLSMIEPGSGKAVAREIASGPTAHRWSLRYDPAANGGGGAITATLDGETLVLNLDPGHRGDGATFNRFGILNVGKSADGGGTIWLGDLNINAQREPLAADPGWEGRGNRHVYVSDQVRPRFDFGFSPTRYAGGRGAGEIGGRFYRGDQRYPERLAYYGDAVGPFSLDDALHAEGRVCMRRGVTDSTTLFGFFHDTGSMRVGPEQTSGFPENFLGVAIEGPSSEGFFVYPAGGLDRESSYLVAAFRPAPPRIYPDGASHAWTFDYNPATGSGQAVVTLDGQPCRFDLTPDQRAVGARFNRFGFVTTHIDGNGQEIYLDDLRYTAARGG